MKMFLKMFSVIKKKFLISKVSIENPQFSIAHLQMKRNEKKKSEWQIENKMSNKIIYDSAEHKKLSHANHF